MAKFSLMIHPLDLAKGPDKPFFHLKWRQMTIFQPRWKNSLEDKEGGQMGKIVLWDGCICKGRGLGKEGDIMPP